MVEILVECVAVPFSAVACAMRRLEYGTASSVMFKMLVLSGCRLQALERMQICMIQGGTLFYHPGKTQKRFLKVRLPTWYLVELAEYGRLHRKGSDRLFSCSSEGFRRYFNKIRPRLGLAWNERAFMPKQNGFSDCYKLQLKGLRKTVMTKIFHEELAKWGSADMALEMTSQKFAHSTTHMTAYHYLREFEQLGLKPDVKDRSIQDELISQNQTSLLEWTGAKNIRRKAS